MSMFFFQDYHHTILAFDIKNFLLEQLEEVVRKNSLTSDQRPTTFLEFHTLQTRDSPTSHAIARPLITHNSSIDESETSETSLHLG